MSGSKKMMLRVQSSEGTARVEVLDTDVTSRLFERVYESLHLNTFGFALFKDRAKREEIASSKSRQLREYGLQHGDMIYLTPVNGAVLFDQPSTSVETNAKSHEESIYITDEASEAPVLPSIDINNLEEDEVDIELYGLSGKIERQRDEKLCNHNANGQCVHCSPLEPWDEDYLKEHNIKHMSFHAYLRKMTTGKFITLEELSFKIKPGCKEHPPWPRGICSSCQPGAVTLNRQPYRHVDNVLVEHAAPVDRFLAYWRATGHQRAAYLLGRYERHADVPLGVRARVAALYEPPQEGARDRLRLLPDARARLVDALAARLGLRRVGWLFTDLLAAGAGQVQCVRGAHSHFLSAQECITAGALQNAHPRAVRAAAAGALGSKWVTAVATGDAARRVHLEGYQVSGQCQALVRDGVLLPTRDAPDLAYIRDSSPQQFVPDVYYKERDAYGNEVNVSAKRLPVAYLLVDVPCGVAPASAPPTFEPGAAFPPAHRALPQHAQSLRALHRHVQRHARFLDAASDFHVLLYLATNDALPLSLEQLAPLLDAVRARDAAAADAWRASPAAATLLRLARAADDAAPAVPAEHAAPAAPALWTCPLCTFHNAAAHDACEMCAMPRSATDGINEAKSWR